jgi:hypothetical protein
MSNREVTRMIGSPRGGGENVNVDAKKSIRESIKTIKT